MQDPWTNKMKSEPALLHKIVTLDNSQGQAIKKQGIMQFHDTLMREFSDLRLVSFLHNLPL